MTDVSDRPHIPFSKRRIWIEPRVRAWWLFAAVLLVFAAILAADQYRGWSQLHRELASGVEVKATITRREEPGARRFSSNEAMILNYSYQGQPFEVHGVLEGQDRYVTEGDVVPLHIDPDKPTNWTSRTEVPSLAIELFGPLLVLPAVVVAAFMALLERQRVWRTIMRGRPVRATVTSNKQTPIAPRLRAISCALPPSGRIVSVFVPGSMVSIAVGDEIDVLLPPGRGRVLGLAWIEQS